MIKFKSSKLSKKDELEISYVLDELEDKYQEFYITKNNVRLCVKKEKPLLFRSIAKGDKIIYNDKGMIFATGWSDKANRYYIKILSEENNTINLFRTLFWNLKDKELWIKVNKDNKNLLRILQHKPCYFKFFGDRGREVLLVRNKKEGQNGQMDNKR